MRVTTIRITREHLEWVRSNRPQQLSHIVREHLDDLMQQGTPVGYHNAWRESAQKCYPHMRGGHCAICWPAGIPTKLEWSEYIRSGHGSNNGSGISHIGVRTFEEWSSLKHEERQTSLAEWNSSEGFSKGTFFSRLIARFRKN